jgi:ASCH domain-containing protein
VTGVPEHNVEPLFTGLPAISLWQPWASLIALGVKRIETRSWPCPAKYIGERVLIHAAKRPLPLGGIHVPAIRYDFRSWEEAAAYNGQSWLAIDTITDSAFKGPQPCNPRTGRQRRIPKRAQTPTLFWPHSGPHHRPREDNPEYTHTEYLPLGAILATATITASLPIVDLYDSGHGACVVAGARSVGALTLWPKWPASAPEPTTTSAADQLPYGDFTPGRWAWLLDDVAPTTERCPSCNGMGWTCYSGEARYNGDDEVRLVRPGTCIEGHRLHDVCAVCDGAGWCDPVPAKGRQGFWRWTP